MYDLILKKKKGQKLNKDEIDFIVKGYTRDEIPDYQMSAFLMAVCFQKMDDEETANLTMAMAKSGDMLDLSGIHGKKVDKHSTGGVGDKTSLIVGPMVAALSVPVAKMSGRGLGHTGGTIDKLESFKGFSIDLPEEKFIENVNRIKLSIIGQTKKLAPADKKIYALRDVTGTVDEISLIASSIMSKKIAAGADVIVLDVKTGSGAFMKTLDDSIRLAQTMVNIGTNVGKTTFAIISDMNQPLGFAIGNTLEVIEAIQTLKGEGPKDLFDASLTLASYMLLGAGNVKTVEEAREKLIRTIEDGSALAKLAEFVVSGGGDEREVYQTDLFQKASIVEEVFAEEEGFIAEIDTEGIGISSLLLGGGRETKDADIDLSVGIILNKKLGEYVSKSIKLATLYANDAGKLEAAKKRFISSYRLSDQPLSIPKHIYGVVTEAGYQAFEK